MTTAAVVMMAVAILVLWGGLALAMLNVARSGREEPDEIHRDL